MADLKLLEDLIALARTGSFVRAAELRHVTHPAFGRRIRALEAWAGAPLVERQRLPVVLTAEGEALLKTAVQVVEQMGQVLRTFQAVTEAAPDELTVWYHTYQFPPFPEVPEPIRGKAFASIAVAYLGSHEDAEALLAPFREIPGVVMDLMGEVPIGALGSIADEPTDPTPARGAADMYEHLLVERDGGVARVTLNRPEVLNALNPRLVAELREYFGSLDARSRERVVILRAAGRAFCAGLDLKAMSPEGARKGARGISRAARAPARLPSPARGAGGAPTRARRSRP